MFYKFKIEAVFEKIDTPKIRKRANEFPEHPSNEYCIPLLTAGVNNQGFARFAKRSDCPLVIKNCLSVSANGANSGATFFQPYEFAVLQDAYAVKIINRDIQSESEGLYLAAAMNKAIKSNHDWVNKAGWAKIKHDFIVLPVVENSDKAHKYTADDIDWQYMREKIEELEQKRIAELEQKRIAELNGYLTVAELESFELTEKEQKALCFSGEFRKFSLGSLFSSSTGDVDLQQKDINGNGYYLINSGTENQGIKGKTDRPARIFPANTITIDFWGNAYYRDFEYKMATHNHVFSLSGAVIKNKQIGLYIVGALSKLPSLFSYTNMATWNRLKNIEINLPVLKSGEIDFDFMESYICAIEKLVIADVAKHRKKIINETKNAI